MARKSAILDGSGNLDFSAAEALFQAEVHDRASEVVPGDSFDWLSLAVGWALAKGASPDQAAELAAHIRYRADLG